MAKFSTIFWLLGIVFGVGRLVVAADAAGAAPLVRFVRQPDGVVSTSRGDSANFSCLAVDAANNTLPVKWTLNGRLLPSTPASDSGLLRVVDVAEDDEGYYRCVAQVAGVGAVLSKAVALRLHRSPQFRQQPTSLRVRIGQSARFECRVDDDVAWPAISWLHNGLPLAHDNLNMGLSTSDSGILQIVAAQSTDSGEYQCVVSSPSSSAVNVTSRPATLSISTSSNQLFDSKATLKVLAPPQNATSNLGKDVVFECLFEEDVQVSWKRADSGVFDASRAVRVGSNLRIRAVELGDAGVYACTGTLANGGDSVELRAHLFIRTPPIIVSPPEDHAKRQGVSVRFHCPSIGYPEPTVTWYKDGVELKPAGRIKMHPTSGVTALSDEQGSASSPLQYVRDLLISEVQTGDEGIYQCVVANSAGETSASAVLRVQANISAAPKNFRAEVDQKRSVIRFFWEAPDTVASDTPYYVLLTYYLTDGGVSNTIVLENVDCEDRACSASCCTGYTLEPYQNYTLQMSMVVVGQAIGPLSEKITAITWDGVALESAPLKVTGLADRGVRLEWTAPNKLPGKLEQYRIEYYEETDAAATTVQVVPYMVTSRNFLDLIPNATYNFRIIPKTRGGYPTESALAVRKQFPWVQYTVPTGDRAGEVDAADTAAAPTLRVDNINETAWLVVWQTESSASKFIVAYRSLAENGEKRRLIVDGRDRSVVLTEGLVKGVTYEISVFAVDAEGKRGLAASQLLHVPVSRPLTTRGPATEVPPKPVMCQPPCTCEAVGGGVMRLSWIRPNGGSSKITHYLAHYTLDENDGTKEWRTFRTEMESALLVGMASNTTYRLMIESCNSGGCSKGQLFDCTTPVFPLPPPPKDIIWTEGNGNSLLELKWTQVPTGNWSPPIGYVIYLRDQGGEMRQISVDGADSTRATISSLSADRIYWISLATRSDDGTGNASATQIARLPLVATTTTTTTVVDDRNVIVVYSYKEGIIVGVCIAALCLAVCAFVLYMRFRTESMAERSERPSSRNSSWTAVFFRRRRRTPAGAVKLMGGMNGTIANGSGSGKGDQLELDDLLPSPTIENGQSDAKGGDGGARPSGCSRYTQLINQRRFEAVHNWTSAEMSPLPPAHLELSGLMVDVDDGHDGGGSNDGRLRFGDVALPTTAGDVSSNLSHSPVTASSLQSWSHEERMSHPAASSLPNLTDSGIGFDELTHHSHLHRPKPAANHRCWCRFETGTHPMRRPDDALRLGLDRSTPRSTHTSS